MLQADFVSDAGPLLTVPVDSNRCSGPTYPRCFIRQTVEKGTAKRQEYRRQAYVQHGRASDIEDRHQTGMVSVKPDTPRLVCTNLAVFGFFTVLSLL